jgi:hypothetical protein
MSFITTNPNPHILNLPTLQNVITSATGNSSALTNYTTNVQKYINTSNSSLTINTVGLYTTTLPYITFTSGINLSNASLYINGTSFVSANSVSGSNFLAFQVSTNEQARITSAGNLGIGIKTPLATLDVNGSEIVRGSLYISTMGAPVTSTLGNLYADGDLFANGMHYPSDPVLKTEIRPYIPHGIPEAVRFRWKASGEEDIGVLANDVLRIEPVCVQTTRNGTLAVDYPKLVVLCLAEIKALKERVTTLESSGSHL